MNIQIIQNSFFVWVPSADCNVSFPDHTNLLLTSCQVKTSFYKFMSTVRIICIHHSNVKVIWTFCGYSYSCFPGSNNFYNRKWLHLSNLDFKSIRPIYDLYLFDLYKRCHLYNHLSIMSILSILVALRYLRYGINNLTVY